MSLDLYFSPQARNLIVIADPELSSTSISLRFITMVGLLPEFALTPTLSLMKYLFIPYSVLHSANAIPFFKFPPEWSP